MQVTKNQLRPPESLVYLRICPYRISVYRGKPISQRLARVTGAAVSDTWRRLGIASQLRHFKDRSEVLLADTRRGLSVSDAPS